MGFKNGLMIYTILECEDKDEMLSLIQKSKDEGADIVELCLHSLSFAHLSEIEPLLLQRILPSIVSFRPKSPKNVCAGHPNKKCLQVLKRAVELDVDVVDIDIEVASDVLISELMRKRSKTKIMVSSHVNAGRICREKLANLVINMQCIGADVIKLVIHVSYITDVAPLFHILTHCQVPLIIRAVGDRGLISQLLGPKYGASWVCGSLGENSIPGLPSLASIRKVYNLENVNVDTKIYGVVSNPVGHSKGPLLHNPAFRHVGYNGIYVPLLVDNLNEFFRVYSCNDFAGFSVGIPHKEAAVQCCDEVHPLAKSIGAVNTIIRRPDGKLVGYNTDCEACITAIEDALRERHNGNGRASNASPIAGKLVVLVGAGGAGRAIAFGAKSRGARIAIFNRNFAALIFIIPSEERAKALAMAVSGEAYTFESLDTFCPEKGMILVNASAVGMQPNIDQTPVPKEALRSYDLVFDAVYTPRDTRLLQEAAKVGATVVSGVEMFIRQALGQFKLFTDGLAPEDFMSKTVLEQF